MPGWPVNTIQGIPTNVQETTKLWCADTCNLLQGQDRDLLARRLSNAAASSASSPLPQPAVPVLEKRLSRRTSQQVPHWQSGRSTVQQSAVDLLLQRSGQVAALPQPSRRISKLQSAASGICWFMGIGSHTQLILHKSLLTSTLIGWGLSSSCGKLLCMW